MLPLPEVGGTLPPIINQTVLNEWALSFTETDLLLLHCNSTDTVPALRKVVSINQSINQMFISSNHPTGFSIDKRFLTEPLLWIWQTW